MMKARLTTSFRDAIKQAHRLYGCDDNSIAQICRRALKSFKNNPFEYSACNDKTFGNPVSIDIELEIGDLSNKEWQGLVIAYLHREFEVTASRRKFPLQLDECDNYIIKE
jgi:hypothetical protein